MAEISMYWKIEMAKNQDCLQTNVSELRETDSLLPHDQQATTSIPSCHCMPGYRARRVRSKRAVLVIMWIMLACSNVACYRRLILKLYMDDYCCALSVCWLLSWCIFWEVQDHEGLHLGHVFGECWWHSVARDPFTSYHHTLYFSSSCLCMWDDGINRADCQCCSIWYRSIARNTIWIKNKFLCSCTGYLGFLNRSVMAWEMTKLVWYLWFLQAHQLGSALTSSVETCWWLSLWEMA